MITRTDIIKELSNKGFNAEKQENLKNGVIFKGICIRQSDKERLVPMIYTDQLLEKAEIEGWDIGRVTGEILEIYRRAKEVNITDEDILSEEYVKNHLYIGLQKQSDERLVKKDTEYEGIEQYLYVRSNFTEDGSNYTTKVKIPFLVSLGIKEEDAWKLAQKNTFEETKIETLNSIMEERTGQDFGNGDIPMYMVTNNCMLQGAAAILNKKEMKKLAKKLKTSIFIMLPSSVHEILVLPYYQSYKEALHDLSEFSWMVQSANRNCVDPWDVLANHAYVLEI